jgi:hypothetical protein
LRDAHGNERGAHEQGDEHDGCGRARDADERFQQAGEAHEHGVGAVEKGGDGREGIEVHEGSLRSRDVGIRLAARSPHRLVDARS